MTPNILIIFLALLFLLGGIGIFVTNQKKERSERRNSWIKYVVYFFVISTLFASIIFFPALFGAFCILIVLGGGFEMIRLQRNSCRLDWRVWSVYFSAYIAVSVLFCLFGFENQDIQLFTLITVCSFDAFSQISGQLFGKRKICPRISPAKTIGGTVGGAIVSMFVCVIAGRGMGWDLSLILPMGLGIAAFSFFGDIAASYVKRQCGVKDFGRVFPGHGGFLDRFDSLIVAGAFVNLLKLIWI